MSEQVVTCKSCREMVVNCGPALIADRFESWIKISITDSAHS